eukprot:1142319-Alexandrium_andersonii.AAC.1
MCIRDRPHGARRSRPPGRDAFRSANEGANGRAEVARPRPAVPRHDSLDAAARAAGDPEAEVV